jgi:hypothetical protein
MAQIKEKVQIFDPAIPFQLFDASDARFDTWHNKTLVKKEFVSKLPHIQPEKSVSIMVSGNMYVTLPLIKLGIIIGNLKIDEIEAVITDDGDCDILFGSEILNQFFTMGDVKRETSSAKITGVVKDDPTALSIEFYPVQMPVDLKNFEAVLKYQRILYNIFLITSGEIPLPSIVHTLDTIEDDYLIPENLRLKLSWVDSGSIWLTLKGALTSLKYLSKFYVKGATATLAQKIAQADQLENESKITKATRDAVISQKIAEQEALKTENIKKKYESWRDETRSNISFADDLIAQITDKELLEKLREQKDIAISQLIQQQILPIVRNYPRELNSTESQFLLPPSSENLE